MHTFINFELCFFFSSTCLTIAENSFMDMENEPDDSLELGSKTWNRIVEAAVKTGYREGIDEGSQAVLQKDFDTGYDDGFRIAFILGKYKALASHVLKDVSHPPEITKILETTRRGGCHICNVELQAKNFDEKDIQNHKEHTSSILKLLYDYFEPILKEKNLNSDTMGLKAN